MRKEKTTVRIFPIEIVLGIVAKSYAPCICHARTFPVLLVMSPVHAIRVFVHPIYAWKQIHAWMQICSEWNEATLDGSQCLDLMYGQVFGWSYVIPPGMQRFGKQRWRQALECRHVQERILIPCCICSWHARDLRISTQITVSKPESYGNCSQMKAYSSDRIWGRRKGRHRRRWENQCCLDNHSIFSSYMSAQHVVQR